MGNVKKVPLRKCIGCNEMKNKKEMMRVLKTTDDQIVLDTTGRKNGRGAYVCFSGRAGAFAENADPAGDL